MRFRENALAALRQNPLVFFPEGYDARLDDPSFDLSFDELGMDSLAGMELSIWLELEQGHEVTVVEVQEMESLNGLARFLASRSEAPPEAVAKD
jgi:acyl carrier protein